jgi:hypothetical protein
MKVSDKSGKHRSVIQPRFSLLEVISELVHNKDLVESLCRYKDKACLFLCPWRCEIYKNNEFRVIVNNGYITGISQQSCYKYCGLDQHRMITVAKSILNFYEQNKRKIPYCSCVMDVWVDGEDKTHLIEINPGEMWCSSGSALFNWVDDRNKLYQEEKTYVRYIDIMSPMLKGKISGISLSGISDLTLSQTSITPPRTTTSMESI